MQQLLLLLLLAAFLTTTSPLMQGQQQRLLYSRQLTSSSSTPPHPIRIHTHSRHELRLVTNRLTGPDHKEQSILAGSPCMQPHCACLGKAVTILDHAAAPSSRTGTHPLSTVPQLGTETPEPPIHNLFHSRMLLDMILCASYAGRHRAVSL